MNDKMEIIIGDRVRRMGVTLDQILNYPNLKFFFRNLYHSPEKTKSKTPGDEVFKLKGNKLFVSDSKVDVFFCVKLREAVSDLCGMQEECCNVVLDLNGEYIRVD